MVPVSRRRLLAVAGSASLGGCTLRDESDGALPDPLAEALAAVPQVVEGSRPVEIVVGAPQEYDGSVPRPFGNALARWVGISPRSLHRLVYVRFADVDRWLVVATGQWTAGWVTVPEAAVHTEDGFAIVASSGVGPWDAGLEAARDATGFFERGLDSRAPLAEALDPIADSRSLVALPTTARDTLPGGVDVAGIDVVAYTGPATGASAEEPTLVAAFSSASDADPDAVERLLAADDVPVDPSAASVQTRRVDGRLLVATIDTPAGGSDAGSAAPDVETHVETASDGRARVEFRGNEPLEADAVHLCVDGRPVADPPWTGTERIAPYSSYVLDLSRFSMVRVQWRPPDGRAAPVELDSRIYAPPPFAASFDPESGRVTVRYYGLRSLDLDALEVLHELPDPRATTTEPATFADRPATLEHGDEFVLTGFEFGDGLEIEPTDESPFDRTLLHRNLEPPHDFWLAREDGRPFIVYRGDATLPADRVRVAADGGAIPQFEGADRITAGDRWLLEDASLADHYEVEFAPSVTRRTIRSFRIPPAADLSFAYDPSTNQLEITHVGGDSLPLSGLGLYVGTGDPERLDPWPELETIAESDTVTAALPRGLTAGEQSLLVALAYAGRPVDHAVVDVDGEA